MTEAKESADIENDQFLSMVNSARAGDQNALEDLMKATQNRMFFKARGYARNDADAQEILQRSYIKAFQNLQTLEDSGKFIPWLSSIVTHEALSFAREANNRYNVNFTDLGDEEDGLVFDTADERIDTQPEMAYSAKQKAEMLQEILNQLPDEQRIAVMMYFYDQKTTKEIADEIGCKEVTVKARIRYAKDKIKEAVLNLEKREGIKLYNISPMAFFILLMRSGAAIPMKVAAVSSVAAGASSATSASTAASSAGTAAKTKTAVSAAAKLSAGTKIGIGTAVVVCGVSAAVLRPKPSVVWTVEPSMDIDRIMALVAYPGGEESGYAEFEDRTGYPATWENSEYTPDALIIVKGDEKGIYSYEGTELQPIRYSYIYYTKYAGTGFIAIEDPESDHVKMLSTDFRNTTDAIEDYNADYTQYIFRMAVKNGELGFVYIDADKAKGANRFVSSNGQYPVNKNYSAYRLDENNDIIGSSHINVEDGTIMDYPGIDECVSINGHFIATTIRWSQNDTTTPHLAYGDATTGKLLTDYVYQEAGVFMGGYASAKKDGKWGFIKEDGTEITDFIFDDCSLCYEGKVYVRVGKYWGILDLGATLAKNIPVNASTVYEYNGGKAPEPGPASTSEPEDYYFW